MVLQLCAVSARGSRQARSSNSTQSPRAGEPMVEKYSGGSIKNHCNAGCDLLECHLTCETQQFLLKRMYSLATKKQARRSLSIMALPTAGVTGAGTRAPSRASGVAIRRVAPGRSGSAEARRRRPGWRSSGSVCTSPIRWVSRRDSIRTRRPFRGSSNWGSPRSKSARSHRWRNRATRRRDSGVSRKKARSSMRSGSRARGQRPCGSTWSSKVARA